MKVDLIVANGKKVQISIQEGQDPKEVARTYGRIYSLNEKAQQLLENALERPTGLDLSVYEQISIQEEISSTS